MSQFPFLPSKGVMAQRIRDFDWASTPLGDVKDWPAELKAAAGFLIDSRFPGAIVWGSSLITIYNDAFLPILGEKQNTLGQSFADIWTEAWPQIQPLLAKAFSGEAVFIENFPLVIRRSDRPEQAYFTFCYSPLRMADGTIGGMMDTVVETTETVKVHAERALLGEELSHRLKNTISMVQAISRQTLKSVAEREAVEAFDKRLNALGTAHDLLTKQSWSKASMKSIMASTLSSISDRSRIDLNGCDVELGPRAVLSLSMLLHELATNAEKYGSLSTDRGRVRVNCNVEGDCLVMVWEEYNGPPVAAPSRRGFGSRIIDMGLGGKVASDFRPTGLVVRIEASLSEIAAV